MVKIRCLFVRDFTDPRNPVLTREVTPGCEWVLNDEGSASRKRDGTACMVKDGVLYKRYDAKRGKTPPEGAIPCTPAADPVTGHWPHWVVVGGEPESKHHLLAWTKQIEREGVLPNGTYELCGPHFSANPEGCAEETFFAHGTETPCPTTRSPGTASAPFSKRRPGRASCSSAGSAATTTASTGR